MLSAAIAMMEHKVIVASSEVGCSSTGTNAFTSYPLCTLMLFCCSSVVAMRRELTPVSQEKWSH